MYRYTLSNYVAYLFVYMYVQYTLYTGSSIVPLTFSRDATTRLDNQDA